MVEMATEVMVGWIDYGRIFQPPWVCMITKHSPTFSVTCLLIPAERVQSAT